ncbi:MAG TPA: hypothetical protein VJT32_00425 [bacterium]|nr:hypothetical protein [bacterium]
MRGGRRIIGGVMCITGMVWLLQGIRVLPGSFMTGSSFWAIAGAVVALVGIAVLIGVAPPGPR